MRIENCRVVRRAFDGVDNIDVTGTVEYVEVRAYARVPDTDATLAAIRARDTDAEPVTLAEMQALGLDELAVALAAAAA